MTRISGYQLHATPCCKTAYTTPNYRSMNFMAWEYWTDGYRGGSLMPNDQGLRQCKCGNFYLLKELLYITNLEESDAPATVSVQADDLPSVIAQARTAEIECAARLALWHHLNHPYRERYRTHRDAEEAATKAAWEAANPDNRSWWQHFRNVPPPKYSRPQGSPFTCPPFELSPAQRENVLALLRLHASESVDLDTLTLVELHRELGQFDLAEKVLRQLSRDQQGSPSEVLSRLVNERSCTLIRYRM